jgi:hypothetical protein
MPQPDAEPTGSGFRGVLKEDGRVIRRCPHVHFTTHSAKNCAERVLLPREPATPQPAPDPSDAT